MTYNSLKKDIQQYLNRGGVSDTNVFEQIPRFIMLAQRRLTKEAPALLSTSAVTTTLEPGNPILEKPDRWNETMSFTIGVGSGFNTRQPLYLRTYEYCRLYWPDPSQSSADSPPKFYADYDQYNLLIVPTPALAYPVEGILISTPEQLSDSYQTNVYTQKAPDLLLHAALLEATVFVRNATFSALEQTHYDRLLQGYGFQNKQQQVDAAQDNGKKK